MTAAPATAGVDPYAVLGVARDADEATIRKAYRKLARQLHPDVAPGKEEQFKAANQAFELLTDPGQRSAYDARAATGAGARPTAGFGPATAAGPGFSAPPRPAPPAPRGKDVTVEVTLSFTEALTGTTVTMVRNLANPCPDCAGGATRSCEQCSGAGFVLRDLSVHTCPACSGSGRVTATGCPTCAGAGQVVTSTPLTVRVPAGVRDGQQVKVSGRGGDGPGGPGDAYLSCRVAEHPVFGRDRDNNLLLTVPVTADELIAGATVTVPTFDGSALALRVPAGSRPGATLRARGRGPTVAGRAGDLLATLELAMPEGGGTEQAELHARLAALGGATGARSRLVEAARAGR